jgi:hypothetical protein
MNLDADAVLSTLRICPHIIDAVVRTGFRTAQFERHIAIVNALLVSRFAANPLLAGQRWFCPQLLRFPVLGQYSATLGRPRLQQEHHGDN